jgi:hypothetical protein
MLAERTLVPLVLGNLLGLASVVAWSATPDEADVGPQASGVRPQALDVAEVRDLAPQPAPVAAPPVGPNLDLPDPATDLDAAHFAFVVDIDGEPYVQLDQNGTPDFARLAHGPARFAASNTQPGRTIAWARVADAAVPAEAQRWLGKELVVDGACRAHVDRFALRNGLGGISVADLSAEDLLASAPALVGHLDGCAGGSVARDAALPVAVVAVRDDDAADAAVLVARATADLEASELGRKDMAVYETVRGEMALDTTTAVVIHPVTKARYVLVQVRLGGQSCGEPAGFAMTGVYRVGGEGGLTRLYVGAGSMDIDEPLVDLMNDGTFERIRTTHVETIRGAVIASRVGDGWQGCGC